MNRLNCIVKKGYIRSTCSVLNEISQLKFWLVLVWVVLNKTGQSHSVETAYLYLSLQVADYDHLINTSIYSKLIWSAYLPAGATHWSPSCLALSTNDEHSYNFNTSLYGWHMSNSACESECCNHSIAWLGFNITGDRWWNFAISAVGLVVIIFACQPVLVGLANAAKNIAPWGVDMWNRVSHPHHWGYNLVSGHS